MLTNDDATYTKASFSQQRHFKDFWSLAGDFPGKFADSYFVFSSSLQQIPGISAYHLVIKNGG